MSTLHLVTHTHWDREWYMPFQLFRIKLVRLIDKLLDLMIDDLDFKYFMLDGQTSVLEDYLQIRPERENEIRQLVQAGRLLIGPWYILPDEFLVSPEAIIRNLLQGDRISRRFGSKMMVGYIPDPFGHISQMPQILSGFGIYSACLQRGLPDLPCEILWQSPDGSQVFTVNLREGYGNAAQLPTSNMDEMAPYLNRIKSTLKPHSAIQSSEGHFLLMHGTDHTEPVVDTSRAIAYAKNIMLDDELIHSNLSEYVQAIQSTIQKYNINIPIATGEFRSSIRHHLLPGVLSTRVWIKQRNHTCETLLEKWCEPFCVWAECIENSLRTNAQLIRYREPPSQATALLQHAWHLLLDCQPHDSICGCSIDQVAEEMRTRFDQVEQIGEEITRQSLEILSKNINTLEASKAVPSAKSAIIVYNPISGYRTDIVEVVIERASTFEEFIILDENGEIVPYEINETIDKEVFYDRVPRNRFFSVIQSVAGFTGNQPGLLSGFGLPTLALQDVNIQQKIDTLWIYAILSEKGIPNLNVLPDALSQLAQIMTDPGVKNIIIRAFIRSYRIKFLAHNVPGRGYKTYWINSMLGKKDVNIESPISNGVCQIENEYYSVQVSEADGTLLLLDKHTNTLFTGLNRFSDTGDCGDEYNYCPPAYDQEIFAELISIEISSTESSQTMEISYLMQVPTRLSSDRQHRSDETISLIIITRACLHTGIPRLDIQTIVTNQSLDHRLRVHFPAPFQVTHADYDGHFQVIRRQKGIPDFDETWVEQPRPEVPQRFFTDISSGKIGLMIANRGLREVEVLPGKDDSTEIAITLLRCVGWLSRDDLSTRKGHAGPGLPTPGAQMQGVWHFEYSIVPHAGDWKNAFLQAYAFNAPMRAIHTDLHQGILNPQCAQVDCKPDTFVISALKKSEDNHGWILRGFNIESQPIEVSIKPWQYFTNVTRVSLGEEPLAAMASDVNGFINLTVRPYEIISIKFEDSSPINNLWQGE